MESYKYLCIFMFTVCFSEMKDFDFLLKLFTLVCKIFIFIFYCYFLSLFKKILFDDSFEG